MTNMGDTQPLASNEHYALMDVGESRTNLNIAHETVINLFSI
jgi:hypothetical protein